MRCFRLGSSKQGRWHTDHQEDEMNVNYCNGSLPGRGLRGSETGMRGLYLRDGKKKKGIIWSKHLDG